jgi:hypothetical protein
MEKAQICYPNQNPASKYPATPGREQKNKKKKIKKKKVPHYLMPQDNFQLKCSNKTRDTIVTCTPNFGKTFNISSGLARGQTAIETILVPVRPQNIP